MDLFVFCCCCFLFCFPKIYDKRDDFDFDIVTFLFLDGEVPRRASMVYTFRNLLGLLKSAIMLIWTSTSKIRVKLLQ